jgi:N-methylhydantoinase A
MRALGIDIGGTFTDLALFDPATGELHTHKLLTTPDDPVRAVLAGARALLAAVGGAPPVRIVHGTTLVTNAVVERKGAVTALLTTRGFRDVLEIRREGRYDLYDLDLEVPEPLVPRHRRFEALERVDEAGAVVTPLDEAGLERFVAGLARGGAAGGDAAEERIRSWAVTFLHAYADGDHERRAEAILRKHFPEVPVSLSSEVAPEIREYERTSTTVANAYVRPVAEGYLSRLEAGLEEVMGAHGGASGERTRARGAKPEAPEPGKAPVLHIMLSDGGITTPETAAALPIRIVESGPAGGVMAAARIGAGLNETRLLSLDMGGTTAKIAFLDERGPRTRSTFEVDRRRFYKRGSGLPLLVPALDLVEIGAGGGSLAGRGALGTLTVGPESAGADPGPACYARGGTHATVTDADLVLGLLNPEYFLGGAMPLDVAAARGAVRRDVAEPLDMDPAEAAHGVHLLVGSNMAEAARVHAAERGLDLGAHVLVAFGGAGPVHAWSVARQLRMSRVLFPAHAGVESALGFLAAPPAFETARSRTVALAALDETDARAILTELAHAARGPVEGAGSGPIAVEAAVDMRYRGQGAEVRVPLPGLSVTRSALAEAFTAAYVRLYGREVEGVPVEVVTWRVRCRRDGPPVDVFDRAGDAAEDRGHAPVFGRRRAWIPDMDRAADIPVHRRDALEPGMTFTGPALIEETQSTLVLGRGTARVLPGGTILAELSA